MKRVPYEVTVYYHGPRTAFARKVDDKEVIAEGETLWLWAARRIARNGIGNTGRCGYVIRQGDVTIEEVPASAPEYASL